MESAWAETIELPPPAARMTLVPLLNPRAREAIEKYADVQRLTITHWHDTLERIARNQLLRSRGRKVEPIKPRVALRDAARILSDDDLASLVAAYLRHRNEMARTASRPFLHLVDTAHEVLREEIRRRRTLPRQHD
jgi:hypothetical protein